MRRRSLLARAEPQPERPAKLPEGPEMRRAVAELARLGWRARHWVARPERRAAARWPQERPEAVAEDFVDFGQTQLMR